MSVVRDLSYVFPGHNDSVEWGLTVIIFVQVKKISHKPLLSTHFMTYFWWYCVCFVSSILQLLMNLARMNTLTKGILDCTMSSSFVLSFTFKKAAKRTLQTKDKKKFAFCLHAQCRHILKHQITMKCLNFIIKFLSFTYFHFKKAQNMNYTLPLEMLVWQNIF